MPHKERRYAEEDRSLSGERKNSFSTGNKRPNQPPLETPKGVATAVSVAVAARRAIQGNFELRAGQCIGPSILNAIHLKLRRSR